MYTSAVHSNHALDRNPSSRITNRRACRQTVLAWWTPTAAESADSAAAGYNLHALVDGVWHCGVRRVCRNLTNHTVTAEQISSEHSTITYVSRIVVHRGLCMLLIRFHECSVTQSSSSTRVHITVFGQRWAHNIIIYHFLYSNSFRGL